MREQREEVEDAMAGSTHSRCSTRKTQNKPNVPPNSLSCVCPMPSSSISNDDAPLGLNTLPDDMLRLVMSFLTLSNTAAFSYASRVTRDAIDGKTQARLAAAEFRAEKETRIKAQVALEEMKEQLVRRGCVVTAAQKCCTAARCGTHYHSGGAQALKQK